MSFESVEHLGIVIALLAAAWGLFRGVRAFRDERAAALRARIVQEQLLAQVLEQFKPNHGSSLIDRVEAIGESMRDHHAKADIWFAENATAHVEIHRRIDGVLVILAGPNGSHARKIADWHHAQRKEED